MCEHVPWSEQPLGHNGQPCGWSAIRGRVAVWRARARCRCWRTPRTEVVTRVTNGRHFRTGTRMTYGGSRDAGDGWPGRRRFGVGARHRHRPRPWLGPEARDRRRCIDDSTTSRAFTATSLVVVAPSPRPHAVSPRRRFLTKCIEARHHPPTNSAVPSSWLSSAAVINRRGR